MTTCRDIVTNALRELRVIAAGESPSSDEASDVLAALNGMIAGWRAESIVIAYPASVNWRGEWAVNTSYSVNDGVARNGIPVTCAVAHTSSYYDQPIGSPNWASYWTVSTLITYAIGDTFPLPGQFEDGVTAMLAVRIAPQFGKEPSAGTVLRARDGKTAIFAAYMPIRPVSVDAGLTRMPSQIWPYNIDQAS